MILEKYYNKEIVNAFTSITLFIISITSANLLINLFHGAYSHGVGINVIIKQIILTLPEGIGLIAPIAIFLSILLCFGKYFSNNEMFVTLASGVTWMSIVRNTFKPVLLLTVIIFLNTMFLVPFSKRTSDVFQISLSANELLSSITDDKIITTPRGLTLYIKNKSGNELNDVFLYQNSLENSEYKVITSPSAKIQTNDTKSFINFKNAHIYTKNTDSHSADYGIADKVIYTIYDNSVRNYNHSNFNREYLGQLVENSIQGKKGAIDELIIRLNNSITIIVSALLALALCRLRPRQNKYAKLLPSVAVLAVYLSLNMFTNTSMMNGTIPTWIAIWLPHVFFIIFSIKTIRNQNGSKKKDN